MTMLFIRRSGGFLSSALKGAPYTLCLRCRHRLPLEMANSRKVKPWNTRGLNSKTVEDHTRLFLAGKRRFHIPACKN